MGRYDAWEHSALRVLETLSVTWAAPRIAITTDDDGNSHEQLWAAAEMYDPDVWASHVPTYRGYQMKDPDGYEEFLDREVKKWRDEHGGDHDKARAQIHDLYMRRGSITGWMPPEAFGNGHVGTSRPTGTASMATQSS